MAIDWEKILRSFGYPTARKLLNDMYHKQGLTISQIAVRLGISVPSVIAIMREEHIPRRPRGGPNHRKSKRKLGR